MRGVPIVSDPNHPQDAIDEAIKSLKAGLQDGGPPVDSALIMAFIDKELSSDAIPKVRYLIETWRAWNESYWSLRFAVASEHDVDEWLSASPIDCEIPLAEAKSKNPLADGAVPARPESVIQSSPSPRRMHQRRSIPAMAITALILLVGLGTYLMMRPTWVTQIRDGKSVVTLDNRGQVSGLPDLDEALRSAVIKVISGQKIQPLASLPMMPGIRSGNGTPLSTSLLSQPHNTVVSEDRPTFRWKGTSKAVVSYAVRIYDDQSKVIDQSDPLKQPMWNPSRTLPRGHTYTWDVLVTFDSGTTVLPQNQPRPAFRVLSDREFARYQKLSADLRESHLALGTFYLQDGLLDEAQAEFDQLEKSNPASLEVRSLVRSVRQLRE